MGGAGIGTAEQELHDQLVRQVAERAGPRLADLGVDGAEALPDSYYGRTRAADLAARSTELLAGVLLAHVDCGLVRAKGEPVVAVRQAPEEDPARGSVVDVVIEDMPFLIDSVGMELNRHEAGIRVLVHPQLLVRRDDAGRLASVRPGEGAEAVADEVREAWIHVEVDLATDPDEAESLRADLLRVLGDVRAAVTDHRPMREQALAVAAELTAAVTAGEAHDPAESTEAAALLTWMAEDHFVFLGYREYFLVDAEDGGGEALVADPGTGLGVLRVHEGEAGAGVSHSFSRLPRQVRSRARDSGLLNLTHANRRATVHRPSYLDYVGVKDVDADGTVRSERRFLGLYTGSVYKSDPRTVPILRQKVAEVTEMAGLDPTGHDGKALLDILATFPRGELFQTDTARLTETVLGVLDLQERRVVRLFVREDTFGRFVSCLVYVPRDDFTTEVRERMQDVLLDAFDGRHLEYTLRVDESVLARLHFVIYRGEGEPLHPEVAEVERRLAAAARTWTDRLTAGLTPEDALPGSPTHRALAHAFSASYQEDFSASQALVDLRRLRALAPRGDMSLEFERVGGDPRMTLYRTGSPLPLFEIVPVLESLGIRILDERPYRVSLPERPPAFVYDVGLRTDDDDALDDAQTRARVAEAFLRTWSGEGESDGLNRLVLLAGLDWRQVAVLRCYTRYCRQIGSAFSLDYIETTLAAHPDVAALLVALFEARFDPARARSGAPSATGALVAEVEQVLDGVESLDADRILRTFLRLVQATTRTNAFQVDDDGRHRPCLAVKLDPARVPDLPLPRPAHEIFVHSPRVEGVHLRGGAVARGGLRWSDRREDFRTEVLGLMKAQMVKNSVIVPVGAKGGFVVKRPPAPGADGTVDRVALQEEGVACYRLFISSLLDVTDNLVEGEVVPPRRTVRHDGDDPYLVVAADKGTATFSDIANAIAVERGFWLGDAFASGGSAGYDHKAMGITARGAWESVVRHFSDLGVDVATETITAVGVGDMSGDVFGNGMLRSEHLRLLAAFDHRHVFLDPSPDAAASFAERARLFALPRSSWADYDPALISAGGGVFARSAKSIPLSPQVREALGVTAASMAPNQLMSAILTAPVDLLWNGGIGTYVKARHESHAEVGDKANDGLRVDGEQLRARVVGEGGNLGLTQHGRIEFALAGGRVFTDAIDNSAGVDCSDHEVNIKILLNAGVDDGRLAPEDRDALLARMTDDVAALVLADNIDQTRALANARFGAAAMLEVHERYVRRLEQTANLDRSIEGLPDDDEFTRRREQGLGLTTPELAVLMAYTKNWLATELLDSPLPDDPAVAHVLVDYFPEPLRADWTDLMAKHRLRREIVATALANTTVNSGGISMVFRLEEETGAFPSQIVGAHVVARRVMETADLLDRVEQAPEVEPEVRTAMLLEVRRLTERSTRWFLRHDGAGADKAGTVEAFRPGPALLARLLDGMLGEVDRASLEQARANYVSAGAPEALAAEVVATGPLYSALPITEVARSSGRAPEDVARTWFVLGDVLGLDWLREQVAALPRSDRWQVLAREAVRDELYSERSALVRAALADVPTADGSGTAEEDDARVRAGVATWLERHTEARQRFARLFEDVRATSTPDLGVVSVALRELRSLLTTAG